MERVLRLVAEGKLTAEEAGPILDALAAAERPGGDPPAAGGGPASTTASARFARIEVRDHGKRVVDLRVPLSLGRFGFGRVPGLSAEQIAAVERAAAGGTRGPILEVEDSNGDGVRIILE